MSIPREVFNRLESVLEGTGDAIWYHDFRTGITQVNDHWYRMLGFEPGELPMGIQGWLERVHPDDLPQVQAEMQSHLLGETGQFRSEHRLRTKQGTYLWTLDRGKVIERDETGQPVAAAGSHLDITERRHAEEETERAVRLKDRFIAFLTHELRNPLQAILSSAEFLQADAFPSLSDLQRQRVLSILNAGERMLDLINDVLELARLESGQLPFDLAAVPLDPVFEWAHQEMLPLARQCRVSFQVRSAAPLQVLADRKRLEQVLMNLVSNGLKYNRPGGTLLLSARPCAWGIRIEVADTGIGIPDSQRQLVFEAFQRLGQDAGKIPGTGLGLSLARELVDHMGGRIGFHTRADEGTTFWVELRAVQANPEG